MKKLLTAFFALVLIGLPVKAADVSDLTFTNNGIFVAITDCNKEASGELVIPAQIDGAPVWFLRNYAFDGCDQLTSVTIPDGADMGYGLFRDCASLETVNLPKDLTIIKPETFRGCAALIDFDIPDTVTSIGDQAFRYCHSFRQFKIPKSVTSIGEAAFANCENLWNVTIGEGVSEIRWAAFTSCQNLISIIFKGNAPEIISNPSNISAYFTYKSESAMIINSTATGFGDTGSVGQFPLIVISVTDSDGDGVSDDEDAFPNDPNESADYDNDGVGDNADSKHPETIKELEDQISSLQEQVDQLSLRPTVEELTALEAERDSRPSKEAYDAVIAERDARPTAEQLAVVVAERDARPSQAALDAVIAERDARPTAEQLASVEAQRDARPTAEELAAVVAQRDALPTQVAYDAVIAERDARPTTEQLAAVEAERDAKLTTEEITDLRVGSVLIEPINGTNTAILSLDLEQSNNLKDWSTYKQLLEVIPVPEGIGFFRFALDK